jgi:hypothetical protein
MRAELGFAKGQFRAKALDKMRGRLENRHIGLERRTVYRALGVQKAARGAAMTMAMEDAEPTLDSG